MSVKLNTIPGLSLRTAPPKPLRWLGVLVGFVASGILLMRFLGKLIGETSFWWFAIGIPALFWVVLMGLRLAVYMMQQIHANAWDKRREQVILQEVRRGRRAFQILASVSSTAHAGIRDFSDISESLLRNENKIVPQTSWNSGTNIRHSRLPVMEGVSAEAQILSAFSGLLNILSKTLIQLPPDKPVAVLLESTSSESGSRIRELWLQAWQKSAFPHPTQFLDNHGLAVLDHWLDYRIKDNAVLLVVALQLAPEEPAMTGEAVVGVLLGNRLTQHDLQPQALLHRPERSLPEEDALHSGVLQAADWVPLHDDAIKHLWLTGIPTGSEADQSIITAQGKPPLTSITAGPALHNINEFLGDPGLSAPWLAIATAAQAISRSPAPHMIISGEPDSNAVWCTVVSPLASHKENTA
jgi:hypothetical protein